MLSESDRRFWIQHGWHPVPYDGDVRKIVWCIDNLGYQESTSNNRLLLFKSQEDAVQFQLVWGGEDGSGRD